MFPGSSRIAGRMGWAGRQVPAPAAFADRPVDGFETAAIGQRRQHAVSPITTSMHAATRRG